jgi:hypothetical protein
LWVEELKAFSNWDNNIHPFLRFQHMRFCFREATWS